MKFFFLIVNRLQQYYQRNKFIFIHFVLGGVLCSMTFAFFYGNSMKWVYDRNSTSTNYCEYTIHAKEGVGLDLETVLTIADNELIRGIGITKEAPFLEKECRINTIVGERPYMLFAKRGTSKFTERHQIIVSETDLRYASAGIGSLVSLGDIPFTVIGLDSTENYIGVEDFAELDAQIIQVEVWSRERHLSTDDPVMQMLRETFPEEDVRGPDGDEYYDMRFSQRSFYIMCATYAMALLVYIFLLRYMTDSMMDETIISVMVGASRCKLAAVIFLEMLLMITMTSGAGLLLHHILYKPVFQHINWQENVAYIASDYLVLFVLMLVISLATVIPFVLKYLWLSPVKARRQHQ